MREKKKPAPAGGDVEISTEKTSLVVPGGRIGGGEAAKIGLTFSSSLSLHPLEIILFPERREQEQILEKLKTKKREREWQWQ